LHRTGKSQADPVAGWSEAAMLRADPMLDVVPRLVTRFL
jgi:hypothetical protein